MRKLCRMMIVLSAAFTLMFFAIIPASAHASEVATPPVVTHSIITLPHQQCDQLKKAFPGHRSDPQLCEIIDTHTLEGQASLIQSMQVRQASSLAPAACSGGNTATATDQLRYSYYWIVTLYTEYRFQGSGCIPALIDQTGYVSYSFATTVSQSTRVVTNGLSVKVIQSIQSTIFSPFPVSFASCQSRGLDNYGDWPYRSNLAGGTGC